MIIIPAIDIRNGNVVRLVQGNYDAECVYNTDPVAVAEQWEKEGAKMLHVVDLDGAREGHPANAEIICAIAKRVRIPVQMGGGLRTLSAIEEMLAGGVARIIIGTKAFDTATLLSAITKFGADRIVVGIDVANGMVKTEGWVKCSGYTIEEACKFIIECGVKHTVVTDIMRDGTLKGPNTETLLKVLATDALNVIASGGIGSLDNIRALHMIKNQKLFGVIVGKALYDGALSFADAEQCVRGK